MGTAVVLLATLLFAWCAVLLLVRSAFRAVRRQAGRLTDRARSAALTHGSGPAPAAAGRRPRRRRGGAGTGPAAPPAPAAPSQPRSRSGLRPATRARCSPVSSWP